MAAEIVNIRGGSDVPGDVATLDDIPAMMRQLADRIENGEVAADSVLCLVPVPGDWPLVFGWGEHLSSEANIGVLEIAKHWFVANTVVRK